MKLTSLALSLSSLACIVSAGVLRQRSYQNNSCISQVEAELLVSRYGAVIAQKDSDLGDPPTTARAIIAEEFVETSDSANMLISVPLGQPTVTSKQQFIENSQTNPPADFDTIAIYTLNCNKVLWQWYQEDFGSGEYLLKGFHLFSVAPNGQLESVFFEFNSIAAALNTDYELVLPNGTTFE